MGAYAEIEAVNYLLESAGESQVNDLTTQAGKDTEFALQLLNRYRKDYQMRGLSFNRNVVELTPGTDGRVLLPLGDGDDEGILDAELLSPVSSNAPQTHGYVRAQVRGRTQPYLFNVTDDTDQWAEGEVLLVMYTKLVKWDNLPTTLQRAIMASAARKYQALVQGDGEADASLAAEELRYWEMFKAEDVSDYGKNIFRDGPPSMQKFYPGYRDQRNDPSRFRFWRTRKS